MAAKTFYFLNYNKYTRHYDTWKQEQYDAWWKKVKDMPFNPDYGVFTATLGLDGKKNLHGG